MSLNQIAADLLAEKRAAKPKVETRLCKCGCSERLIRRSGESLARFKARRFVDNSHRLKSPNPGPTHKELKDRTCIECGALFNRRKYKTGKLESRQDFENRYRCPEHTTRANSGVRQEPATTFSKDARLPDPTPHESFSHSPKDESNTKRIPSLLEQERAAGVEHAPVSEAELKRSLGRALRLSPEFAEAFGVVFV